MDTILLYFTIKYKGDWDKIYNALKSQEKIDQNEYQNFELEIQEKKWKYFTILDEIYPKWFKSSYKPPFVIFYKGNLDLMKNNRFINVTGDNGDEISAKENLNTFTETIFQKFSLVTGMYQGIDKKITLQAIQQKTKIIFVSANGVENYYSSIDLNQFSKNDILILSEYPSTHISNKKLKMRNRLLASIAEAIIILRAKKDAGVLHIANEALNLGKDVMCFPGADDYHSGCNELIKQGATLITNAQDVINHLK